MSTATRRRRGEFRFLLASATLCTAGLAAACDGASNNSPAFPDVHGTYTLEITFDAPYPFNASGDGSVTIVQPDRQLPELTGKAAARSLAVGREGRWDRLVEASVGGDGTVQFVLEGPHTYLAGPNGDRWWFAGTVTGDVLTGSQGLEFNGGLWLGTFRAVRVSK